MKKTTTFSISMPTELSNKLDLLCSEINVSRSTVISATTSFMLKWLEETTLDMKKQTLNSVYGKGVK